MAEHVIFEYRAEGHGGGVRFHRKAAGRCAPGSYLRAGWGCAWPLPVMVPFGPARRRRHQREIGRTLEALQRMYDELYGSDDSAAGH